MRLSRLGRTDPEYVRLLKEFNTDLEKSGYRLSDDTVAIDRVDNLHLAQRFRLWHAANTTEAHAIRDVWHGTSLKAATNIAAIGFDLRLACAHGRLGKGIYIAEDGAVAHSYALGRSETDEVVVIRCRASLGTECDSSTINSSMPKVGNHYAAPENTWWCVLEEAQVWPTHLIRYKTTNMRF